MIAAVVKLVGGASILSWLKIAAVAGALAAVGGAYWHYTSLIDEVSDLRVELQTTQARVDEAVEIANRNAAAVRRADEDRRRAVSALEDAFASLQESRDRNSDAVERLQSAPEADDGPVAPVLESLRTGRFAGGDR